jgi:hypothetical protein
MTTQHPSLRPQRALARLPGGLPAALAPRHPGGGRRATTHTNNLGARVVAALATPASA